MARLRVRYYLIGPGAAAPHKVDDKREVGLEPLRGKREEWREKKEERRERKEERGYREKGRERRQMKRETIRVGQHWR